MEGTVGRKPSAPPGVEAIGPSGDERTSTGAATVSQSVDMIAGRYKLQEILGRGGVGVVYRARDLDLGEEIAIKVLQGQATRNAQELDRFKREIITARKITHANVIRIHDFGMSGDEAFISMELLAGGTLADRIEDGPLPFKQGLEIALGICEGLEAAHQMGIIHRDIKPDNVLFDAAGRPKLVDFGLARLASAPTRTIGFSGTPFYVSPEQAEGGEVTGRSDIYSLGVLLFEMFTGRLPFLADNLVRLALLHANEPPPAPRSIREDIPGALEAVILRCLEKDAGKRYRTAAEVALDLRAIRDGKAPPGVGHAADQATVIRNLNVPSSAGAPEKTMPAIPSPGAQRAATGAERTSGSARRPNLAQRPPEPVTRPADRLEARAPVKPSPSNAAVLPPSLSEAPTELPLPKRGSGKLVLLGAGAVLAIGAVVGSFVVVGHPGTGAVATPTAKASETVAVAGRSTPTLTQEPLDETPTPTPAATATVTVAKATPAATPAKTATPKPTATRLALVTPTPRPNATPFYDVTDPTPAPTVASKKTGTVKFLPVTPTASSYYLILAPALGQNCSTMPRTLTSVNAGQYAVQLFTNTPQKCTGKPVAKGVVVVKGGNELVVKAEISTGELAVTER